MTEKAQGKQSMVQEKTYNPYAKNYRDKCNKCNGSGHTSADCRRRTVSIVNLDDENEDNEEYENVCEAEGEDDEYDAEEQVYV
ncbi:unnamed protein product, partial [Ilex paraguariensis]